MCTCADALGAQRQWFCLAGILVRSPRKSFIFIIQKIYFLGQSIQKIVYLILKKEALPSALLHNAVAISDYVLADVSVRSPSELFISALELSILNKVNLVLKTGYYLELLSPICAAVPATSAAFFKMI